MNPLEVVRLTLLVIHFVGLAAIIGPFIFQLRLRMGLEFQTMLVGSIVQVVTGIGLIAARRLQDLPVDETKVTVKLVIALLVLAAVIVAIVVQRRAKRSGAADARSVPWFRAAGGLAIANVAVAAVWI